MGQGLGANHCLISSGSVQQRYSLSRGTAMSRVMTRSRTVLMGCPGMAYWKAMGSPLTAQLTPKRSVSMPKVLAQNAGASGIVT